MGAKVARFFIVLPIVGAVILGCMGVAQAAPIGFSFQGHIKNERNPYYPIGMEVSGELVYDPDLLTYSRQYPASNYSEYHYDTPAAHIRLKLGPWDTAEEIQSGLFAQPEPDFKIRMHRSRSNTNINFESFGARSFYSYLGVDWLTSINLTIGSTVWSSAADVPQGLPDLSLFNYAALQVRAEDPQGGHSHHLFSVDRLTFQPIDLGDPDDVPAPGMWILFTITAGLIGILSYRRQSRRIA